jgi:hypothetical protein
MSLEHVVYLVIRRLHYAENNWPAYVDVITEPAYRDSHVARTRLKELTALYESDGRRKALETLGASVSFYLRDVSLVQEMEQ